MRIYCPSSRSVRTTFNIFTLGIKVMMCTWGVPRNPKQNDCFQTMADRHTTVNKRMMRYVRLVKKKKHTHTNKKKSRFAGTFETKTVRPPVKNYPRYPSLQKQKKNLFLEKNARSVFFLPPSSKFTFPELSIEIPSECQHPDASFVHNQAKTNRGWRHNLISFSRPPPLKKGVNQEASWTFRHLQT